MMNNRSARVLVLLCLLSVVSAGFTPASSDDRRSTEYRQSVDLALVLDTSGSMKSLLDAARAKLWETVNLLATAEPRPRLRVALLSYGHKGYDRDRGFVQIHTPLTEDLDFVSQQLFALTADGGVEYVGRALKTALDELEWNDSRDGLRVVIVAGNESAEQDPHTDNRSVSSDARREDIVVNTIFCGKPDDPVAFEWEAIALDADGHYSAINSRTSIRFVSTPFDKRLSELSQLMNGTYVPLGEAGTEGLERQKQQDANAIALNASAAATRAATKAGALYRNDWDLIDALASGRVDWDSLDESELPEALREMTWRERETHVQQLAEQRADLKRQILELQQERRQFLVEKTGRPGTDANSFEGAIQGAIREQAERAGFAFEPVREEKDD